LDVISVNDDVLLVATTKSYPFPLNPKLEFISKVRIFASESSFSNKQDAEEWAATVRKRRILADFVVVRTPGIKDTKAG
jgi:hypothetical protein